MHKYSISSKYPAAEILLKFKNILSQVNLKGGTVVIKDTSSTGGIV